MSDFASFGDMLPEHKDALMRDLVTSGDPCTAIMLASTCTQERARFAKLGFKWPLAAARLSAARNGYVELFKWLLAYCHADRCLDFTYMHHTYGVLGQGTDVALFKWYVGPGFAFDIHGHLPWMSWDIFLDVAGQYMSEKELQNILGYAYINNKWKLAPLYYMKKRQMPLFDIGPATRTLAKWGTMADIDRLGASSLFDCSSPNVDFIIYNALDHGNCPLIESMFNRWPDIVKDAIKRDKRYYRIPQNKYGYCENLSVSLLELLLACGAIIDRQETVKCYITECTRKKGFTSPLTTEMRVLLAYGDCRVTENVQTVGLANALLNPGDDNLYANIATACEWKQLINSL